ncbi:MAG: penicillin-binding protein [Bacteroidales bacterium]|uniref:penicillin-binding protein n=1 Tax=Candidatus Cryptobacteroides sp. TaxID=2952915 RepID=UPI002A90DF72|nr:penicillin-binding protein [Candidatus Cryptobacteroides sp.]MDD7136475.1 penicillin-binding protein [Bacteroidales bacterium]MDY5567175.1 penicillin-binding protein [Candidatus Cryptobacteroides sp.]
MAKLSQKKPKKERDRIGLILYLLYVFFLGLSIVFVVRIIGIQWFWEVDSDLKPYFLPSSIRSVIEPERGAIIGCDGQILALSTPMYQLYMDCTVRKDYFRKHEKADSLERAWKAKARVFAGVFAEEAGGNADEWYSQIEKGRQNGVKYLRLGGQIDRGSLNNLEEKTFLKEGPFKSGIITTRKDTRQYPFGSLARRTIGYVKDNSNSNGNNHIGLEGKYDYVLHGKEGEVWLRPTDNKERIQNYDSTYVKPENGMDVRTTLDITLQDITDKALRRQIEENNAIEMGCAVIMEVETGAIRAMVNLVRDPADSSLNETYNMAIGLSSEPGSVFKATTLMTALEDGCIKSLDDVIPTNNGIIPGYPPDDHVRGMKEISILKGFEISSNYVFRYLAVNNYKDDPKKFIDKLYMYKLGQAFDFDLEGLQEPFLPSPDSPGWSATDLGSIGMGYSIQETPLHILTFYNAIANKGKMMKPYLVESIEKNGTVKKKLGPSVLNASICSRATADTLLRAMKAVTSEGTATRLKGAKLQVAGKTGTSRQVLTQEEIDRYGMSTPYVTKDGSYHNLATFVGFFPADAPKYSAIICLKSGLIRGSLYGGVLPAAAIREIVDKIYALDSEWNQPLERAGSVPVMTMDRKVENKNTEGNPTVPDVTGLGLMDALYLIENNGLKCSYSGTGHVTSQSPKGGERTASGTTVNIVLR